MENKKGISTFSALLVLIIIGILLFSCGNDNGKDARKKCTACHGSGYYQHETCPFCHGTGYSDWDPFKYTGG